MQRMTDPHRQPQLVCMLVPFLHIQTGGMERQVWQLAKKLQRNGTPVVFVTCVRFWELFTRRLQLSEVRDGIHIYRIPGVFPPNGMKVFPLEFLVGAWLILRNRHTSIRLFHAHQLFSSGLVAAILGRRWKIPVVAKIATTGHDGDIADMNRRPLKRWKIQRLSTIDRFISINPNVGPELERIGVPADRVVTIPNGVDTDFFSSDDRGRSALRLKLKLPDEQLVLFVGRIVPEKQFHYLIDIWPELLKSSSRAHLVVIGKADSTSGYARAQQEKIVRLGLGRHITFVGTVVSTRDYLACADVFVLPSRSEGLSNALLEAAASGLPIVASRIPGNELIIENQKRGLLFPPDDPAALRTALASVLNDRALAQTLGQNASTFVREHYSLDSVTTEMQSLYSQVTSGRAPK